MIEQYENLSVSDKLIRKYERLYTEITKDAEVGSRMVAKEIANLIRERNAVGKNCVLGLATGSSPIGVYRELVRLHKEEGLSFKNVITFNLDEYYPMPKDHEQSYYYFMHKHLFNHVDIPSTNVNIPDGTVSLENVFDYCQSYEQKIKDAGGIDLQILGIGRTGHVGFNEPGSGLNSPTRLISLDSLTMADAASDFLAVENVPKRAITMGIETIMSARSLILMAWGDKKATIIKRAIEGEISDLVPATYLQKHSRVQIIIDKPASTELSRIKTPWLVQEVVWNDRLIKKAVVWLCNKLDKSVLKLTNRDYNDNNLSSLVANHGPAYDINLKVFNMLQKSITGWPGGKPNNNQERPERSKPYPKKVLIFSPRPADDVITMGGTMRRLVQQGHEVHVAYQTSGNIAVSDDEVVKYLEFVEDYNSCDKAAKSQLKSIRDFIKSKKAGESDNKEVLQIKSLIRKGESLAACRFLGINSKNIHFLNMPFYETGKMDKAALNEKDVELNLEILRKIQPHQVYASGDLTDPHGTRRKCYNAVEKAFSELENDQWFKDCWTWLYKGSGEDWGIADADMIVPISPEELHTKRLTVFKHSSQKEMIYPGTEEKQVWKYAEERNRETAEHLNKLGMAEYEAAELFVRFSK
jgi:glucosamine-6-phosphate deaminase